MNETELIFPAKIAQARKKAGRCYEIALAVSVLPEKVK
jgi:hypothetical protein